MRGARVRYLAAATILGLVAVLPACTVSTSEPAPSEGGSDSAIRLPDEVADKRAIDVASFFNYPPYTIANGAELEGIEADLLRAIADELGVEARFHDLAFEAMIPSIVNGRNDVMIGALADTPDRRKQVSFLDIWRSEMRVLVPEGNPNEIDPANLCGLTSGESAGSYQATVLKEVSEKCEKDGEPAIKQLTFTDPGTSFLATINGRTDFTLQDPALARYTADENPDLEMLHGKVAGDSMQVQGWIFAKDNEELLLAFAKAIDSLIQDGTWHQIMEDAGLSEVTLLPPTINTKPVEG